MEFSENGYCLSIIAPDDFHHHLRDGEALKDVVDHASKQFARVVWQQFGESKLDIQVM